MTLPTVIHEQQRLLSLNIHAEPAIELGHLIPGMKLWPLFLALPIALVLSEAIANALEHGLKASSSLGLRLSRTFARQLDADYSLTNGARGAVMRLVLPMEKFSAV